MLLLNYLLQLFVHPEVGHAPAPNVTVSVTPAKEIAAGIIVGLIPPTT